MWWSLKSWSIDQNACWAWAKWKLCRVPIKIKLFPPQGFWFDMTWNKAQNPAVRIYWAFLQTKDMLKLYISLCCNFTFPEVRYESFVATDAAWNIKVSSKTSHGIMLINFETQWPLCKYTYLCHTYKCWNTVLNCAILLAFNSSTPRYVSQVMRNAMWRWYVRFCGIVNMAASVFAGTSAASISSRRLGWTQIQLTCGWWRSPWTGVVRRWTSWHSSRE